MSTLARKNIYISEHDIRNEIKRKMAWQKARGIKTNVYSKKILRIKNERNKREINNQRTQRRPFSRVEETGLYVEKTWVE